MGVQTNFRKVFQNLRILNLNQSLKNVKHWMVELGTAILRFHLDGIGIGYLGFVARNLLRAFVMLGHSLECSRCFLGGTCLLIKFNSQIILFRSDYAWLYGLARNCEILPMHFCDF